MPRPSLPTPSEPPSTACFSVQARALPGVMPRVLELFARRGLVPSQWHSVTAGAAGEELHIDIQVDGVDREQSRLLAAGLGQLVHVEQVLTSEKRCGAE